MKQLVLLGAGLSHIHLLSTLTAQRLASVQTTLITPSPRTMYADMLPGFVAGRYTFDDCAVALAPLLSGTDVQRLTRPAVALDLTARTVSLDDGSSVPFDVLSVNAEPAQDRQLIEKAVPGAREHALFARPLDAFGMLWPQVVALAQNRALRVTVIGGGRVAVELAFAVAQRLKGSSVTLLCGHTPVGAWGTPKLQARIAQTLKSRGITVMQERATGISAGEVRLSNGARLTCDVPIMTVGMHPPAWLQDSGLALDAQGHIAVDAYQRAAHHPQVFAANDANRQVNTALTDNLRAVLAGVEPRTAQPPPRSLEFLACGGQQAMASWGNYCLQGRWVGWLKARADRALIQQYSRANPA
jgi:NADH dehydrogenase FAD-containing subunit